MEGQIVYELLTYPLYFGLELLDDHQFSIVYKWDQALTPQVARLPDALNDCLPRKENELAVCKLLARIFLLKVRVMVKLTIQKVVQQI